VLERRAFPQLAVGSDDGEQAGREPAAIASARIRLCVSWPANSTSRLSGKFRKKVILVSPPARTILVAIPPVTHSSRDKHGFIPILINIARNTDVSGYVDEGANRWPAAHTLDVAVLYTMDITMPNADTRQLLGWEPDHPGLIADLDDAHYFTTD
jgi:hypothetical protein